MSLVKKESFKTTCSYCGVGCGIVIEKDYKGKLSLKGDEDHPVNHGMLCSKGMNLLYTVQDQSDRLLYPQMRWSKNHPLERTDWDTALTRASAVFKTLIQQFGPDSVGFYISGQFLTEEYYLANKLVKGFLGTNNIDTNSRLCMSSAVAGYTKTLGEDVVPIAYEDIELADCFLIAGANPAWCHPILFRRIEKHKEENPHIKLIVVDPRITQTCALADLHLQIKPGTDTILFQGIGRCLIEQGDIDNEFVKNHTEGFAAYCEQVMKLSLEEVAQICDVPITQIQLAAQYIGEAKGFLTMWTMGLNQSTNGVNKNLALINLNLITGHIGKPGSGPFSLTGQPNAMGGREVGGMATLLAAHRVLSNPEHRQVVADFWKVKSISEKPGLTAVEMFEALRDGKLKAVWIACTNPSVSLPSARLVDEALKNARFVVVQDISQNSDTLKYADLVLPAAAWLEKEGTMTNSERRISHLSKVVNPPEEALPDWEILARFAQKMRFKGFDYESPEEIYAEYCQMTKGTNIDISGLNGYKKIKANHTIQWPVPNAKHQGTTRLFEDKKFFSPSQKAQIQISGNEVEAEATSPDFPLILTTGRIRDQWHTMTKTAKVSKLNKHIPKPFLEIHPLDAETRGIRDNDILIVHNQRGEVKVRVKVTDTIKVGVVFLPMHWGKILNKDLTRANNLTDNRFDPTSKEPGFKYCAVQVEKYQKPREKIVIVGAGAAAYRFITSYRELNQVDEIEVFSQEIHSFYNRVLLPEYVNENMQWRDLLKFKTRQEFEKLNVSLHEGISIEKINRKNKTIVDSEGKIHFYDKLILATGSRAFVPPDAPIHLPGVFTMRNRRNADDLKKYLKPKAHVLIVGGGLLGLELAGALREIEVEVTIVQLASRLMQRQLDSMASKLLLGVIEEMGVQVFLNDEVKDTVLNQENRNISIELKSGITLQCDAAVYAIGTRPNIELGKEAELACGRGLLVNDHLQTSDENIFAMGEIAEHRQKMNGITAAAEQQADCLANFLAGDWSCTYEGSVSMNILKFAHLDLCSIGEAEIPAEQEADKYEEILLIDQSRRYYKKCIVHKDRLVGAILMGDKVEFAEYKTLIEEKTELSEKRTELLRSSGGKAQALLGKLVCSCGNVGEGNIRNAIDNGCGEFKMLCKQTGAGLGCGSCKPEVKNILDSYLISVNK
jgi:ferredoxin-nitrate reductase